MQIKSQQSLTHALACWGAHEASGRLSRKVHVDTTNLLSCTELALLSRPQLTARILLREPIVVFEVELTPSDLNNLVLANGQSVEAWRTDVAREDAESNVHIQRLIDEVEDPWIKGSLLCAATLVSETPTLEISDTVLYDGWHRAAAFLERARLARASSVPGTLVLTRSADSFLPAQQ